MDITIFGYKLNVEILILIGVVYLILVGHLFCGCCNVPRIMEGLESMSVAADNAASKALDNLSKNKNTQTKSLSSISSVKK
jgi:hypothetical protein